MISVARSLDQLSYLGMLALNRLSVTLQDERVRFKGSILRFRRLIEETYETHRTWLWVQSGVNHRAGLEARSGSERLCKGRCVRARRRPIALITSIWR